MMQRVINPLITLFFLPYVESTPFSRKLLQSEICDPYCNDPSSSYCSQSPLFDSNIVFTTPEIYDAAQPSYSKCASMVNGEPLRCPPIATTTTCESCGYSWTNPDADVFQSAPFSSLAECCPGYLNEKGFRYDYNYEWNKAKAYKSAYASKEGSCWVWYGCNTGYECKDRNWYGKGTCKLSSDYKYYVR
jgi:hypothetical protein